MTQLARFVLILLLGTTVLAAQGPSGSYVKLRGARLTRFEKTSAASEARRPVQLVLPAKLLTDGSLKKLGRSKRWVCFEHNKVLYYLRRQDPYLIQSQRKAGKQSGAQMLLKGKVKSLRLKGKKTWAVRVESLQVKSKRRKRN